MNKILAVLGLGAVIATGLAGCADENPNMEGEGRLLLGATINADLKSPASRAAQNEDELAEKCMVWISSSKGLVRRYQGLDNVPADGVALLSGHYVAEAWIGDSVPASFDDRWFKAREEFDIRKGENTRVTLSCRIANVAVAVNYLDGAREVLKDYTMTVSHSRGTLVFEGDDERIGYYMMPSTDKDLKWTLQGTLANGNTYSRTGTLSDVLPAHKYVLNVNCEAAESEFGGAYFTVEVDDTEIVCDDPIVITIAPQISGYGFNINQPVNGRPGELPRRSVLINSATELTSVVLDCPALGEIMGFDGSDVDLITMDPSIAEIIDEHGITRTYTVGEDNTGSLMKINFEKTFTNALAPGEHNIVISATDENGKTSTATLVFNVSEATAQSYAATNDDVWTTTATLRGIILRDDVQEANFKYRPQGSADWATVPAVPESRAFAANTRVVALLENLQPATTYEYVLDTDGTQTEAQTFTTGAVLQLPNADFEIWNALHSDCADKDGVIVPGSDYSFWDSGNHGSITMGKNITESSTDYKHSGSYSAKLKSQFVGIGSIGKFAAGNVFAGNYLYTDGTDGELGWGRPFTARPKAVKMWVRYEPGTAVSKKGAGDMLPAGATDQGIVYIALTDQTTTAYDRTTSSKNPYRGSSWPAIIKTKSGQLFDPNGANVIAYGAQILDRTADSGMVELTIPLDYLKTNVIPSYILFVASASRYGDYFQGGEGSTLYLDDIELVY